VTVVGDTPSNRPCVVRATAAYGRSASGDPEGAGDRETAAAGATGTSDVLGSTRAGVRLGVALGFADGVREGEPDGRGVDVRDVVREGVVLDVVLGVVLEVAVSVGIAVLEGPGSSVGNAGSSGVPMGWSVGSGLGLSLSVGTSTACAGPAGPARTRSRAVMAPAAAAVRRTGPRYVRIALTTARPGH
jgi:hypothetical protein